MEEEKDKPIEGEGTPPAEENKEPDYKVKSEELEQKLSEANGELEKLKGKETNFGNLKKQTEEEKTKHENEKKTLQEQINGLTSQIDERDSKMKNEWYDSTVSHFVGDDKEKLDAVKAEYDILNMPSTTRAEVVERTKKAMKLAGYELKGDLSTVNFGGSREADSKETKYTDTDRGKGTYNALFPDLANKDK